MVFSTNIHDRPIYRAVYKITGETIYLIIQVDDFALYFSNESVTKDIYNQIGGDIQLPIE